MGRQAKSWVFKVLECDPTDNPLERAVDSFMMGLILLNVAAVILETVEGIQAQYGVWFTAFEALSVAIFTVEYVLRLWSCTVDARFSGPVLGRIRFALNPLSIVDLLAILPFYLPMFTALDLRFIRAFRLLRVLKMTRYSESMRTFGRVLHQRQHELGLTIFILSILLVTASSLMYFVESEAQPEAFSSIPAAMWWGIVTLTTVGYGDIYPVTLLGKILGACIALPGIGMFALPAGILGSSFIEEFHRKDEAQPLICPHCGRPVNDVPTPEPVGAGADGDRSSLHT